MSKIQAQQKGTNNIPAASPVADNDLIVIIDGTTGKPKKATISEISSGGILNNNNTWSGINTYALPQVYDHDIAVEALIGGGQTGATALAAEHNNVTVCASDFDSVKLPVAVKGQKITIKNSSANILSVFPFLAGTINAMAVNLSVDIPAFAERTFRGLSAIAWETNESLYLSAPTTQKGGIQFIAADNAGNTILKIINASQAGARVYTIPDAGGNSNFSMTEIDIADYAKFLGLNDIIGGPVAGPSTGTWAMTRVAQGDYVNRKVAGDETPIISLDITENLRIATGKGLKLTTIDFIFRNTVENLDAHSATLDRIEYTDSEVVSVNTIAMTGTLATGQDNDPQISTLTITTPLFNVTDNSKYVLEHTMNAAASSVIDWIGVVLKYTRNDK